LNEREIFKLFAYLQTKEKNKKQINTSCCNRNGGLLFFPGYTPGTKKGRKGRYLFAQRQSKNTLAHLGLQAYERNALFWKTELLSLVCSSGWTKKLTTKNDL